MLSTYWKAKSDGYELVDGSNHSSASSRSSSPSLDHHYLHHPFDIPARRSKSTSLTSQTLCILRRNRRRVTLIFLAIVVIYIFESILGVILSPPAYVVLPPDRYVQTLEASLQDRMQLPSTEARKSILANIKELGIPSSIDYHRSEGLPPITSIPNNLFSSDQYEQPSEWAPMWKEKGFEAHFYNDSQANTWVEREWNGTDIIEAWRKMPRSIL
jgi:alpha 1,6-mannosyltransferase